MHIFHSENHTLGILWPFLALWFYLVYFWYILWPFLTFYGLLVGIFYGLLAYCEVIWYILLSFDIVSPVLVCSNKKIMATLEHSFGMLNGPSKVSASNCGMLKPSENVWSRGQWAIMIQFKKHLILRPPPGLPDKNPNLGKSWRVCIAMEDVGICMVWSFCLC
jgi:hypothetical protein